MSIANTLLTFKAKIAGIVGADIFRRCVLTVDPVENRGFEYHTGVTFSVFARGAQRPAVHRLQADPPQALPVGSGGADVQVTVRFGRELFRVLLAQQARGRLKRA